MARDLTVTAVYSDRSVRDGEWWNYRVVFRDVTPKHGERGFTIHEVFYKGDGIVGWESSPAYAGGETWPEFTEEARRVGMAFRRSVLQFTPGVGLFELTDAQATKLMAQTLAEKRERE